MTYGILMGAVSNGKIHQENSPNDEGWTSFPISRGTYNSFSGRWQHLFTSFSFIYTVLLKEQIILQIENEYETEDKKFGEAGFAYMNWAAKMAVQTDTGVPWVMCKQDDAPDPMVSTGKLFICILSNTCFDRVLCKYLLWNVYYFF